MENEYFVEMSHDQRLKSLWKHVQRGLVYPAPHAVFATFWLNSDIDRTSLSDLMKEVMVDIQKKDNLVQSNTSAVLGVSIKNWKRICSEEKLSIPSAIKTQFPNEADDDSVIFEKSNGAFVNSEGDIWFHIKSDNSSSCEEVLELITAILGAKIKDCVYQEASSKSDREDGKQGKVLGCRFSENLNNPSNPIAISKHILTGVEDIEHIGSSVVLAQRFQINWPQINAMAEDQIEDMIGRKTDDTIIPDRDTRSHIKSARIQDEHGNSTPVLRLGLPFGKAAQRHSNRLAKSATVADEQGIYFAGFINDVSKLENIMMNQIGSEFGFMNDRLFNNVRSDLGGFFYIPSLDDLDITSDSRFNNDFECLEKNEWNAFPGVDWSRLDRHFVQKSKNGRMYYNHKNYLYKMSTMSDGERKDFNPPSARILSLLENIFSLWQDNWYINRKQEEITLHLKEYMDLYRGDDKPSNIMEESVMIRKGWAIRMSLHLFTDESYGFRGRKVKKPDGTLIPYSCTNEVQGDVVHGSDTFRISPEEIIVGAMPNLSLGEGRYCMKYLSEDERQDGFLNNLSEASGVGHVIPDFEGALKHGLSSLIAQLESRKDNAENKVKNDFYQSSILTLKGASEYCLRYAKLATLRSLEMKPGQKWEKYNLESIAKRMTKLATDKPETFVEALQLIFTLHSCLHLNGEPTALGRLDQILAPYLGTQTESEIQDVIDAFYIKLDEKVQQNRIFMEDHQEFGNLAMGGSSVPYPQGASLGQWVQQVTVGGTIADGTEEWSETKPAYNELTKMFIRASARLPLNAPCLSLRTRADMPKDILEEAAKAILSGGAHPILLNDEKIIKGLYHSGDGVGGKTIHETTDGHWQSEVSLKSAQNYACDGCYEPQFPGENWFSLGGFSTLQPLECALNKGRTYSSAGSQYLFGQVASFTSPSAEHIESFDDLLTLYYKHFDAINRKSINGQLMGYGANSKFCPSPLLNIMMPNCIESGRDYYSGGAKYNIYGPCYIALSSTINSLWAIKTMVFDQKKAVTTLPELLEALCCDWGHKMTEPFISKLSGEARIQGRADRFKRLREIAESLPKYGRGNSEIDSFGNFVITEIASLANKAFTEPLIQTKQTMERLAKQMGCEEFPFGIQIQPGVGTFENQVAMGSWNGASADGRRLGASVASDLSPAPSASDKPVEHQLAEFKTALAGFEGTGTDAMCDGAPTDFNINEDFPLDALTEVLEQFAQGKSSNILTVTVADPDTFSDAMSHPEKYDLLRVRTGGWTNFFTSVFPVVQEEHLRRPVSTPGCPFTKS